MSAARWWARLGVVVGSGLVALAVAGALGACAFAVASTLYVGGKSCSGVTSLDQQAGAAGSGGSFASGSTGTTASAPEFVFGAVAVYAGTQPVWAGGWTALPSYAVGSNHVGRAYRIPGAVGSFDATGAAGGDWLAACVTFR
jgi:hypothetical protein